MLQGQTNEQAAEQFALQQVGETDALTEDLADIAQVYRNPKEC